MARHARLVALLAPGPLAASPNRDRASPTDGVPSDVPPLVAVGTDRAVSGALGIRVRSPDDVESHADEVIILNAGPVLAEGLDG